MEDDIRNLVQGKSPPRPDAKSLKSRSKSTTAKSSKKKKKSSDAKSKSKSTTTGKKKRDKSRTRGPDPATLTIQVPPATDAVSVPLATLNSSPLSAPPPAPAVSEHLREIINDSTIPVATPATTPRADPDTHEEGNDKEKEKASKPRKKKETKKRSSSSKRKEQEKQKQRIEQQQKEEEEVEEKRKRRERLLVSPFEFLHITPFRHDEDEFHDDISFLTLPKPLRDQESKMNGSTFMAHHLPQVEEEAATPQAALPSIGENHESNEALKLPAVASSNTATDPQQPLPAPGWARKAKAERTASSDSKEQASTDLSHSPEISSLPSAHPHHPSPLNSVMTSHIDTNNTSQNETSNARNESPPKNLPPPMALPMDEPAATAPVVSPQTLLPTLDRPRSWSNVDQPSKDPPASTPHLAQESPSLTTQESSPMLTQGRRQGTVPTANNQVNNDIESGNALQQRISSEENKNILAQYHSAKNHNWFLASAALCFVCLIIITIILVVVLAKN